MSGFWVVLPRYITPGYKNFESRNILYKDYCYIGNSLKNIISGLRRNRVGKY